MGSRPTSDRYWGHIERLLFLSGHYVACSLPRSYLMPFKKHTMRILLALTAHLSSSYNNHSVSDLTLINMAAEYSKGRDFISSTKYQLPCRNPHRFLTPFRMNYFHYFLKQLTGYTLHPLIKIDAQPCRIADMGVQTA